MSEANGQLPADIDGYLQPTRFIDSDSEAVRAFVERALAASDEQSETQKAVRLFHAVRDDIRYDPYAFSLRPEDYTASAIAGFKSAYCVPKAILLTACLRAVGIPAAVGFADVRNHLNSPKLSEMMQTDLFIYHGYVQLWLGDRSFKVTPAFNSELCGKFGVKPLEFDGTGDALFHEFDTKNRRHMEYVRDRGIFQEAPMEQILSDFREFYPNLAAHAEAQGERGLRVEDEAFSGSA
ncbi:transglutaminase-like domain-containing protein [Hoeflea poritis]|uniref:Transglutaminase family protein n=1 Tax=Hoeflea poritis TaxID=2993659 RepID=A0ABT4VIC8_9HYPH|nr:transglutaminase family protein [Hoeflea poritis]MDA4844428.1 transglutaminase family protein [Hoeflea poritis]